MNNPISGTPLPANFPDSISSSVCAKEDFSDCSGANGPPQKDEAAILCPMCYLGQGRPNRIHGHVNWFPVTYTGTICFHDLSFPDMDYTFSMQPEGRAGLTRWNAPAEPDSNYPPQVKKKCGPSHDQECLPKAFHVEFDSLETIERFRSPEWVKFRALADPCGFFDFQSCEAKKARDHLKLKRAVVVGLAGIDSEHNIYSELHPVYAIAIEMSAEVKGDTAESTWMVFARNDGDEGACSADPNHYLYGPDSTQPLPLASAKLLLTPPMDIPAGMFVSGAAFDQGTTFYSNNATCPATAYYDELFRPAAGGMRYTENNQGVLLSFDLRPCGGPGCTPLVEGEIHLRWRLSRGPGGPAVAKVPKEDECASLEELDKEERAVFKKPTPEQASQLSDLFAQARLERLNMRAAGCTYAGDVPDAPALPECAAPLTTVRPKPEAESMMNKEQRRRNSPYKRIADVLAGP